MLPGIPTSGDGATSHQTSSAAAAAGSDLGFSEDEKGRPEDGGRSSGNRWPRQETLYLLQIRSDMDAAFRDSSLKGPLWDEVSRKLASLGFHRSAKKCKEKFENVYKYHKRIKEGRSSKADGKTYKFFEQLQALEASPSNHNQPPLALPPTPVVSNPPMPIDSAPASQNNNNVDPISVAAPAVNVNPISGRFSFSQLNMSVSNSSSSSTSSDDEPPERRRSRKRKWKEFFGKLMTEVINKQEELQSKFLDTLDRRERDRTAREEAWRLQEMAKMKREHELLVQERSMVAAKDAAVITLLQKITEQNPNSNPKAGTGIPQIPAMQLLQQQQQNHPSPPQPTPQPPPLAVNPVPVPAPVPVSVPVPAPVPVSVPLPASAPPPQAVKNLGNASGGGAESMLQPSPSRWPKAEIDALINLRTTLENKYQENGPKGPLWEEVSAAMRNLGYNRNAKRCKEKWENINKYYKKVKESSKKRPEDSKTCPYFHQLDAIYREKASGSSNSNNNNNPGLTVKTETQMAPIMARPEQQWPLLAAVQEHQHHQYQQQQQQLLKPSEPIGGFENHPNADLNEDEYDDDEEDDDDDDEEDEGGNYEVVPNKTASMA